MYLCVGDVMPGAVKLMGKPATVLYLGGCNFKCPWCYAVKYVGIGCPKPCEKTNMQALLPAFQQIKDPAVIITGGEPTLQKRDLEIFCRYLKQMKKYVKVHTNGSHPEVIGELIHTKSVDEIALDIKAPLNDQTLYNRVTGTKVDLGKIEETMSLCQLDNYEGMFEVVVPIIPGITDTKSQIRKIASKVGYCGSFVIQGFDNAQCLSKDWQSKPMPDAKKLKELAETARDTLKNVDFIRIRSKGKEEVL